MRASDGPAGGERDQSVRMLGVHVPCCSVNSPVVRLRVAGEPGSRNNRRATDLELAGGPGLGTLVSVWPKGCANPPSARRQGSGVRSQEAGVRRQGSTKTRTPSAWLTPDSCPLTLPERGVESQLASDGTGFAFERARVIFGPRPRCART